MRSRTQRWEQVIPALRQPRQQRNNELSLNCSTEVIHGPRTTEQLGEQSLGETPNLAKRGTGSAAAQRRPVQRLSSPQFAAGGAGQGSFIPSLIHASPDRGYATAAQRGSGLCRQPLQHSTTRTPAAETSSHLINHNTESSKKAVGENRCLENLSFSG